MIRFFFTIIISGLLECACTTIIPKNIIEKVNTNITFEALKKNPLDYRGQTVLLAGVIVKTHNTSDGATLEIYQTEMDWEKRPIHTDISKGRFLVDSKAFLDPEIYSGKREVTVAGTVMGIKQLKLGEMDYAYPVIRAEAIHLWEKGAPIPYEPGFWYPMGGPWGYWGPWGFWGPWYGPPFWYN